MKKQFLNLGKALNSMNCGEESTCNGQELAILQGEIPPYAL